MNEPLKVESRINCSNPECSRCANAKCLDKVERTFGCSNGTKVCEKFRCAYAATGLFVCKGCNRGYYNDNSRRYHNDRR